MIKRTHSPKAPSSRPVPRRRRRPILPMLRRAARWSALVALAGLAYGGFALSRSPGRDALLAEAADRAVAVTASLGMVVDDIEVEGRETTESAMIMAALAAGRGTPILAVDLWRAKNGARKAALGPIRRDRAAAAAYAARAAHRTPAARAMAARGQAACDRPPGRGDTGRRFEPLRPPAAGCRRQRRDPCGRAGRDARARTGTRRPGYRRGPGRRSPLEPARRRLDRGFAARGKPRSCWAQLAASNGATTCSNATCSGSTCGCPAG